MSNNLAVFPSSAEYDALCSAASRAGMESMLCGVGLAAAIEGFLRVVGKRPRAVFLLGVCGAYPVSGLKEGDVVRVERMRLGDQGVRERDGRLISMTEIGFCDNEERTASPDILPEFQRLALLNLPGVFGLTVVSATGTAEQMAERYAQGNPQIEEMEGVVGAIICRSQAIPFFHVRAVSNLVGPRDRGSWKMTLALESLGQWLNQMSLGGQDD